MDQLEHFRVQLGAGEGELGEAFDRTGPNDSAVVIEIAPQHRRYPGASLPVEIQPGQHLSDVPAYFSLAGRRHAEQRRPKWPKEIRTAIGGFLGRVRAPDPDTRVSSVRPLAQHRTKQHVQQSRLVSGERSNFIRATDGAAIPAGERCDDGGGASRAGSGCECATGRFSHSRMIRIGGPVYKGRSVLSQRSH